MMARRKETTVTSVPVSARVELRHAAGLDLLAERANKEGLRATRSSMVNEAIKYYIKRQRVSQKDMTARVEELTKKEEEIPSR